VKKGLLVAFAAILIAAPLSAADYYVKNGGNDSLDGLSAATAWATLQHAADLVNPGDTVHVLDGTYAGFYVDRSGTAANPITFLAQSPAVQITSNNAFTPDGINVENASYVIIDGFTVNNRTRAGIRTALSSFVTIRNCHCGHNGRWGIFSGFADDLTIENNETHNSQLEHGIYVSNSGDRPIIRDNLVHDNFANGIHMNGDLSQGSDGLISNAVVERNIIYGNGEGGGSGINMDGVTDSVVRNNLLYDNHASGISLYRIDGATGSRNNLVINNTVINAADGRWCININNGSTGNTLRNNILYNYHSFRGVITIDSSSRTGFSSDYNSLMSRFSIDDGNNVISFASWQAEGYDANSFLATPADHFVNPSSDFHLLDTSPAVDTGTSASAPNHDIEGNPRPVGAAHDAGAYELQLLECGDGNVDAGEQCGEPGLSCTDPCTACSQCICVEPQPTCGDGFICGSETCENDGDCAAAEVCSGCQCQNPLACASGIAIQKPRLQMFASEYLLSLKGEAVIPRPWTGVDPLANGIRFVVDAQNGPGGVDVAIPGGAFDGTRGWKINSAANRWTYVDPDGTVGGVLRAVVKDRSVVTDGLVHWAWKAKGGTAVLPDVSATRATVIVGAAQECASVQWNPPGGLRPRCDGDAARIVCR
jgi:parallel beta-helix repeat protein